MLDMVSLGKCRMLQVMLVGLLSTMGCACEEVRPPQPNPAPLSLMGHMEVQLIPTGSCAVDMIQLFLERDGAMTPVGSVCCVVTREMLADEFQWISELPDVGGRRITVGLLVEEEVEEYLSLASLGRALGTLRAAVSDAKIDERRVLVRIHSAKWKKEAGTPGAIGDEAPIRRSGKHST